MWLDSTASGQRLSIQLPVSKLTNLQELLLGNFDVQFQLQGASTGAAASTAAAPTPTTTAFLPALQELGFKSCTINTHNLCQLSQLTALTSLQMKGMQFTIANSNNQTQPSDPQLAAVFTDVLRQLSSLRVLALTGKTSTSFWSSRSTPLIPGSALAPLSAMHHLESATFSSDIFDSNALQYLPTSSLTFLELSKAEDHTQICLSPDTWPQAAQHAPRLATLKLHTLDLTPNVLASLTDLLVLKLHNVDEHDTDELLRAIGQMTRLERLHIQEARFEGHLDGDDALLLANLTASSHLTYLALRTTSNGVDASVMPLPEGGVCMMLPAGRTLPHLRELHIDTDLDAAWRDEINVYECLHGPDIERIAECMPGLHTLSLLNTMGAGLHCLSPLQPRLTNLCVGGDMTSNHGMPALAKLTSLRALAVMNTRVTVKGLAQLTALTGLTRLLVTDCPNLEKCVCDGGGEDSEDEVDRSEEDSEDGEDKEVYLVASYEVGLYSRIAAVAWEVGALKVCQLPAPSGHV